MFQKISLFTLFTLFTVLTACGSANKTEVVVKSEPTEQVQATSEPTQVAELTQVDVGVGFIPNVQFVPFYVAQNKGFFAEEGLEVTLEYGFEHDFIALTAQGEKQFAVASGEQVILARSQDLPIVYIMNWYKRFPVGVMALAESGIDSPEKLNGKTVGIPSLFGANFAGWKAMVYSAELDESTITLNELGFTQAEALTQGNVDAAVVYITNEPVQLSQAGMDINLFEVSDYVDLVANGLITNETVIQENPELVRSLVKATVRGLEYTLSNPDEAFAIVRETIPEITDEDAITQRAVLDVAIELWQTDQPGLSNQQSWADSVEFMVASGLIEAPVEVDTLYTNQFVE